MGTPSANANDLGAAFGFYRHPNPCPHAGVVADNPYTVEGAMTEQESTTAVMVWVEDGKVREIRVDSLERVLSVLAALAIRNGQISLDGNQCEIEPRGSRS
ncbi:MAG: hypothetical protein QN194_16190 [Armatimonadota bacterium]|nr:hypothetical protein [Armatimonadota bacterium]